MKTIMFKESGRIRIAKKTETEVKPPFPQESSSDESFVIIFRQNKLAENVHHLL